MITEADGLIENCTPSRFFLSVWWPHILIDFMSYIYVRQIGCIMAYMIGYSSCLLHIPDMNLACIYGLNSEGRYLRVLSGWQGSAHILHHTLHQKH